MTNKPSYRWLGTLFGRSTELIRPSQSELLIAMRRMAPAAPNPYGIDHHKVDSAGATSGPVTTNGHCGVASTKGAGQGVKEAFSGAQ